MKTNRFLRLFLSPREWILGTLSTLLWLLLLGTLAYQTAPHTVSPNWSAANPFELLEGFIFALSFGFGLPLWLSVLLTVVLSLLLWWALRWLVQLIYRRR